MGATRWARADARFSGLKVGYFGVSTGAAAALIAAARLSGAVGAVVSRGGRPDLAAEALPDVSAPTLLIVGGATRLFEEPGALEEVSRLAGGVVRKTPSGPA